MFWIALEMRNPNLVLISRLSFPVKELTEFRYDSRDNWQHCINLLAQRATYSLSPSLVFGAVVARLQPQLLQLPHGRNSAWSLIANRWTRLFGRFKNYFI